MVRTVKEMLNSTELTGLQIICISVITSAVTFLLTFVFKTIFDFFKKLIKKGISKLKSNWSTYKLHKNGRLTIKEMLDLEKKINEGIPLNNKELKMKIFYDKEVEQLKDALKDIDFKPIPNIYKPMDSTIFFKNSK